MDLGLLYKAMEQGRVTMIAANATDGMLSKMDLQILRDDRHAFSALSGVHRSPAGLLAGNARITLEALLELSGKFTVRTNRCRDTPTSRWTAQHLPVAKVATDFLRQAGLE